MPIRRDLPLTAPAGRVLRFERDKTDGFLISFFDKGRAMPGLQQIHLRAAAADEIQMNTVNSVDLPQLGEMELRTDGYDVRFWLGIIEVGQMNFLMWKLGLTVALGGA